MFISKLQSAVLMFDFGLSPENAVEELVLQWHHAQFAVTNSAASINIFLNLTLFIENNIHIYIFKEIFY
ncbi:hypothetical protein ACJX0J_032713 [Zea mays]